MPLQDYLLAIRQAISGLAGVQVELYREQLLTAIRANLRIRLRLVDQSLLEISEALVIQEGELARLSYRYHWQNVSGQVLFRYDDAPHHPEVDTFPHHKHVGDTVIASPRPHLLDVLEEMQRLLNR
jgi:Family of unknown function (DUF6516)